MSAHEKSLITQRFLPIRSENRCVFLFPQSGHEEIDIPWGDRKFGSEGISFGVRLLLGEEDREY